MSRKSQPPAGKIGAQEVTVDPALPPEVIRDIVQGEKTSAKVGRVVGVLVMPIGVALLVLGVSAQVDLTFSSGGANAHFVTGAVGVVVILVGAGIIYATRYRVTATK
jgi:hypothetical protein